MNPPPHFISYEKIADSPNQWNLSPSDYRAFNKTHWVVTEKIHGANFCIVTDGEIVRFAKRKEFLESGEDFFGFKSFESQLVPQVREIFQMLQAASNHPLCVSIYGELFGGEYPHPDVPPTPHIQPVQTGVYYSPNIQFCAFDIAAIANNNPASRTYFDYNQTLHLCQQVGMFCASPLFIGKYDRAITYNPEFESTIPALLSLPKLPFSNRAEGIVIKPVQSIWVETPKGKIRPILKIKIPDFSETRFHQAQKWNQHSSYLASTEEWLTQALLAMVTENPLHNAISKIGRVSPTDVKLKSQLVQLFVADALETFQDQYGKFFQSLPHPSQQTLIHKLENEAEKFIGKCL
jgi:Rnl2 family RNA ligase